MSALHLALSLPRIRQNAELIVARTKVEFWPTIKANAYGLGAQQVADSLADIAAGFCFFSFDEAAELNLHNKPSIILGPPAANISVQDYVARRARPAVSTLVQARALRAAHPILCVDTGMQRFACPPAEIESVLKAGEIHEAFTHATRVEHAEQLASLLAYHQPIKLHAAASSLLDQPAAYLDAVRPGLALYRGAVRISARVVELHSSKGPIGYSGWTSPTGHHGIILVGYADGLRTGPCVINQRKQRITEVGMQTAYVTLSPADAMGDEVVLLGDTLTESDLAFAWNATPHQTILQLAKACSR